MHGHENIVMSPSLTASRDGKGGQHRDEQV